MPTIFRLAAILERLGVSQADLVRRSGVSQRTVTRLCSNTTQQVSLVVLDKLADALGVAPGDLIAKQPAKIGRR
ncbi:MAG: helix-turn-helix domain-containing protein [Gemmatimonadales bacterium]